MSQVLYLREVYIEILIWDMIITLQILIINKVDNIFRYTYVRYELIYDARYFNISS